MNTIHCGNCGKLITLDENEFAVCEHCHAKNKGRRIRQGVNIYRLEYDFIILKCDTCQEEFNALEYGNDWLNCTKCLLKSEGNFYED